MKTLTAAWEKKNSKAARAGGVSLMALSLAACGGEDNTPFSQADVDAAEDTGFAAGVASVDITTDNAAAVATALGDYASVDAAFAAGAASVDITSNDADIAAAARAEGVASVDITSNDADIAAAARAEGVASVDITSNDADIAAAARAEGVASVDITSNDAAIESAALTTVAGVEYGSVDAAYNAGAASVDITSDNKAVMMTETEYAEALAAAKATVDITTDNAAAINAAVAADTSFSNLADLIEAYNAAIAPAEVLNYVLAATADVISGGDSATVISGTAGTIDGDNINGGGGADTLNLTVTVADDDNSAFTATSVETISIRSTGGTANDAAFVDLNFADVTGMETLQLRRLGDDVEIDDLGDLSAAIELNNIATAADVNINYDAATVSGDSDTVNVSIVSSTGGGDLTINNVETIAVTVTGEDNDVNIDGDSIDSVTIAGAGDLNVDFDASVTTANASANTGGVTMNATAAADVTFTGGTGADTFAMGATLTAADTLDGGDGTDTLTVTSAAAALIPTSASVTNVETLTATINGVDTLDANIVSFDNINILSSAASDDVTITDLTDEVLTLTQTAAGNDIDEVDVSLVDATGAADALTINVTNAHTTTVFNVDLIESTGGGIETLTVNLNQGVDLEDADDIQVDVISAGTALTITGDADAELGNGTALTQTVINAGTATGDLTINVGAAASTVTGGSGGDTFVFGGNLASSDTVVGGLGDDELTAAMAAGTAAASITGVETLSLAFATGSAAYSGSNTTGATTVNISDTSDEDLSILNMASDLSTVRMASDDMAAGDTIRIDYAAGSDSAHTFAIGEIGDADNLAMGDVTITDNAGALTITTDAEDIGTAHKVDDIHANDATSLTVTTAGDFEVDSAGVGGTGAINATSATSATFTTAGGAITVDGNIDISAATTITMASADEAILMSGDVTATAATSLNITATDDFEIDGTYVTDADTTVTITASGTSALARVDTLLDVDHASTITLTASDGGEVDIDDIEIVGTNADGDDITTSLVISSNGEDSAGTNSMVRVEAINVVGATTLDSVTITSASTGDVEFTTGGAALTITSIDASGSLGTLTFDSSTISGAITAEFGAGTNNITTEADLQDVITLAFGAGTDTFNIAAVSGTSQDTVTNFEVGADGDVVSLDVSAIDVGGDGSGIVNQTGTDMASTLAVIIEEDADGTLDATDTTNIIALTNVFADVAAVGDALGENLTVAAGVADDDDILVLWSDGASSYLSALAADWNTTAAGGTRTTEEENLIQFEGISDVSLFSADNFVIV